MNNAPAMARLVREELLPLIRPVLIVSLQADDKTGTVSGRFRSNGILFEYKIGKGEVRYRPLGAKDSAKGGKTRGDGYDEVMARLDAKTGKRRTGKAKCTTGYSCGRTCISNVRTCKVKGRPGLDDKIIALMDETENAKPGGKKRAMFMQGKGRGQKPVRITTENIGQFAGDVDVSSIKGREEEGLAKAFLGGANNRIVQLDRLVTIKDETQDPKFLAGKKNDPRQTAAMAMGWGIDNDPRNTKGPRAPLDVSENGDGTYTIIDGNATAQAAMLAGWTRIPVNVIAYRGEKLDLVPNKPAGAEYTEGARALAPGVRAKAEASSEAITRQVLSMADKHGATMDSIGWRLKTESSIASKIDRDTAELVAKNPGMSVSEAQKIAADTMGDAMRYTYVVDRGYTSKVKAMVAELEATGHTIRVKNAWQEGQAFRGINMAITNAKGERFELQLHTPASKKAAKRMHPLYGVYRESKDDNQRRLIYDKMMSIGEAAGSPYEKTGPDGEKSTNLRERQELLGVGKPVFRGYQSTAEAFPGETSRSARTTTRTTPSPEKVRRRRKANRPLVTTTWAPGTRRPPR